ncbi:enoyl-CoA hydratase/isomerase family protein [Lichenicoccus sp.]|uniref:enoyl-CoA hydratase/isomerase family protein n=1 Tax=Lichenicoccus sp. TaxID=2781899 RepID=UPI003D135EA9
MEHAPVLYRQDGPLAWITLNRPDRLNALSSSVRDGLSQALDQVDGSPDIRAIVVTGNGRAFCAGGDLDEFKIDIDRGEYAVAAEKVAGASGLLSRLENSPRPVIAAVNGLAVAGGLELILCCDMVISAAGVRIGDGHLRYGVLPGGGGSIRLPRKLTPNRANQLLLTGEMLPAEILRDWGLVNEVVPLDQLLQRAAEVATLVSKRTPLGMAYIKRLVRCAHDQPLEEALASETSAFAEYVRSADFREGLAAFAAKREPAFTGK